MFGQKESPHNFGKFYIKSLFWFVIGATIAALGLSIFLIPNQLIDGGIVGLSMIAAHLFGQAGLPYFLILFNLPFLYLAYKQIGKHFVVQMISAVALFALALKATFWIPLLFDLPPLAFHGDALEVIVLGGFTLGVGFGLIIRYGGSTDGTEILGIIANRKVGFTVGQVVLATNIFIFILAGIAYKNWHVAIQSLLTYVVATKVMDIVIVGFDETKSVMIISDRPKHLADILMKELNISLTIMYGRGGYAGDEKEILYIVVERLQLAELKEIVRREDPKAFVAVENLHEVIHGSGRLNQGK